MAASFADLVRDLWAESCWQVQTRVRLVRMGEWRVALVRPSHLLPAIMVAAFFDGVW